jgi:hypothetical protein
MTTDSGLITRSSRARQFFTYKPINTPIFVRSTGSNRLRRKCGDAFCADLRADASDVSSGNQRVAVVCHALRFPGYQDVAQGPLDLVERP